MNIVDEYLIAKTKRDAIPRYPFGGWATLYCAVFLMIVIVPWWLPACLLAWPLLMANSNRTVRLVFADRRVWKLLDLMKLMPISTWHATELYGYPEGVVAAVECYEGHFLGDCPLCGAT